VPRIWESIAPIIPMVALPNRASSIGPRVNLDAIPAWFKVERQYAEKEFGKREAFSSEASRQPSKAKGLVSCARVPAGNKAKTTRYRGNEFASPT
jgi:hypothetical protein